jgi:hypothetical protein
MCERIVPARISANQRSKVSRVSDFVRMANSISAIPLMAAMEREIYLREERDEHYDDGDANSPSPADSRGVALSLLDPMNHLHRLRRFHRLRNNEVSWTEPTSDHLHFPSNLVEICEICVSINQTMDRLFLTSTCWKYSCARVTSRPICDFNSSIELNFFSSRKRCRNRTRTTSP